MVWFWGAYNLKPDTYQLVTDASKGLPWEMLPSTTTKIHIIQEKEGKRESTDLLAVTAMVYSHGIIAQIGQFCEVRI